MKPFTEGTPQEKGGFSSWFWTFSCCSLSVGTLRGSVSTACPEHIVAWWPCSSGLYYDLPHGPPWTWGFIVAVALWLYTPACQSHLTSAQRAVCYCLATENQLWSRRPSQLLQQPVGYDHNLSCEVSAPATDRAPPKVVPSCVFSLSLRYPLEFLLLLYSYSYQSWIIPYTTLPLIQIIVCFYASWLGPDAEWRICYKERRD